MHYHRRSLSRSHLPGAVLLCVYIVLNLGCSDSGRQEKAAPVSLEELRKLKESPMLAKQVAAGQLPPLEERLPVNPLVVEPWDEPGVFGGAWHFDVINRRDINLVYHISNPSYLQWDREADDLFPYLCESYEVQDDGRIWTFHLREGVKWSDGERFTTEDVRFWYEDDAMNRDINPTPLAELRVGHDFGQIRIVDEYTFQVVFPDTNRGFYKSIPSIILFYAPSHYLRQFHARYADEEELNKEIKKAGIKKWSELYKRMNRWYDGYYNPDLPSLRPWLISKNRRSPNTAVFVRNPYYWMVDTDGRQLPYIDSVVVHITSNQQVLAMKTIAGNFDFQWRRLDFKDYPLLKENEERHNYTLLTWPQDRGSDVTLYLNYNCTHPIVGPMFRERSFRLALSLAIDRTELNLLFYKNIGVPRQATAAENTPYYVPEYAEAYAHYDPAEANRLLDGLGLTQRDKNGFRLSRDGEPLYLFIETSDLNEVDLLHIVCEHWRAVGVNAEVKVMEGSLLTSRTQSAEIMILARALGSFNPPTGLTRSNYIAPLYGLWNSTLGIQGEEPSPEFKELNELGERVKVSDLVEEIQVMKQIYKLYAENIWAIGLVGEIPALLAKKNYFMNVPEKSLYSYARGRRLQMTMPEQYWIDPTQRD
ncbi:MAG: ABC transporter substrate-binding protein [Fidelibacterota bacterium]|nr:MAG: ABC transporter substrate-binding protein [Candidatus Neomarinimicrobiota bacterium]